VVAAEDIQVEAVCTALAEDIQVAEAGTAVQVDLVADRAAEARWDNCPFCEINLSFAQKIVGVPLANRHMLINERKWQK
jgi:hypothetical protein